MLCIAFRLSQPETCPTPIQAYVVILSRRKYKIKSFLPHPYIIYSQLYLEKDFKYSIKMQLNFSKDYFSSYHFWMPVQNAYCQGIKRILPYCHTDCRVNESMMISPSKAWNIKLKSKRNNNIVFI